MTTAVSVDPSVSRTPLPLDATDLATIYERLAASGDLAAFEVTQRFYEIGSFAGLQEFQRHLNRA